MAKRSHDFLVSPAEGIEGSKLPSGKQVLGHFLHRHNVLKEDIRTAATRTVERVKDFWFRAGIPIKHRQDSIKKLEQFFFEWKGLKKNKGRQTQTQQANEATFSATIKELFDVAHADAMELIENQEDKLFLESQRKKGRPGCMGGVDKVLLQQQQKQMEKEEKLKKRRHQCQLDKEALFEKAMLESSTDSEEGPSQDPGPSTSIATLPPKRGRQSVISPQLAAMLDRNGLSDRAAMMIIFQASRTFGQDPQVLALNRSTIRRQRQQHRESAAAGIKEAFKPNTTLTVHWDGKLMPDLTGNKVERLPILVSTMGEKKLLEIPKIITGTGHAMAQAAYNAIQEWELENLVRAMCFDTTSSNTGRSSGACIILEQLLGRHLLHFGCRHHILELVLAAAFGECLGPISSPEILVFKRFRGQWSSIDQGRYEDAFSDEFVASELAHVRDEVIAFCEHELQDHQPRDDYRELLKLMLIFLGSTPSHGTKFPAPGPMHQACWMAKAIYSLKVWLFRSQFKLTARESLGLRDLNIFLAKVYLKFWFLAPMASTAARNDLQLLQQLHTYPQNNISAATSTKMSGHLWYLSEDLILFSLFDPEVDSTTKRAILKASIEKEGENDPLKRVVVELAMVEQKTLVDFVSKRSRNVFAMLGMPDGFLGEDPDTWNDRDDFKAAEAIVCSLATTNDQAVRGVALIQDATQSGRFQTEEQLQYALQVIEQSRANIPDAKKSTLLKKL